VAEGVALKAALLAANTVPFNSDEAIVALMARHILPRSSGQLSFTVRRIWAALTLTWSPGFALMGESVLAVRVAQVVLFSVVLLTTCRVALRFTGSESVALLTTLLLPVRRCC